MAQVGGKGIFKLEPGRAREVQGTQASNSVWLPYDENSSSVSLTEVKTVEGKHGVTGKKVSKRLRTGLVWWQQERLVW